MTPPADTPERLSPARPPPCWPSCGTAKPKDEQSPDQVRPAGEQRSPREGGEGAAQQPPAQKSTPGFDPGDDAAPSEGRPPARLRVPIRRPMSRPPSSPRGLGRRKRRSAGPSLASRDAGIPCGARTVSASSEFAGVRTKPPTSARASRPRAGGGTGKAALRGRAAATAASAAAAAGRRVRRHQDHRGCRAARPRGLAALPAMGPRAEEDCRGHSRNARGPASARRAEKQQQFAEFAKREDELFEEKVPDMADASEGRGAAERRPLSVLKDLGFDEAELGRIVERGEQGALPARPPRAAPHPRRDPLA